MQVNPKWSHRARLLYVDVIHERAQEKYGKSKKKVNTYHNHAEVPMYKGFEAG